VNEEKMPGYYTVRWDARGLTSGAYYYQLRVGGNVRTKKTVLLR
jgi:hypothetical protein